MKSKEELKSFFENGDIPKQDEFWEWQDSYWHKNEKLPLENIDYDFSNKADLVNGKIPATQLPSYVDDILEFDSIEDLPNPGESGKIYVITSTNTQLRWSGSEYVQIISGENVMITDSPQGILPNGTKTFWTEGGNSYNNNSLWIRNTNFGGAGITFTGNGIGQIIYNNDQFHFTNNEGTNNIPIASGGFIKSDSDNTRVLLGGGGDKLISDFVLNADLNDYLRSRGIWNTPLLGKSDNPNSVTFYAGDPSITGFKSTYGTSLHIKSDQPWYNRLDISTNGNRIDLWQGINVTNMSYRGLIPIIPDGVTNWDSLNFTPSDFIPRGGTVGGNLLFGMIEADGSFNTGFSSTYANRNRLVQLTDDNGVLLSTYNTSNDNYSTLNIYDPYIELKVQEGSTGSTGQIHIEHGLIETIGDLFGVDYIPPAHGNYYVQKTYVDDTLGNCWTKTELPDYRNYGLGRINIPVLSDVNTYSSYETGIYSINLSAHSPFAYGTVIKSMRSANEGTEIAVSVWGNEMSLRGYVGGTYGDWVKVANQEWVNNNHVPYTGANQPVNIGAQNLSTTGSILSNNFISNYLGSSTLIGGQIINANTSNVLVFGNDDIPNNYYSSLSNHTFIVNGTTRAVVNGSGLSVVGALAVNGETVATHPWVNNALSVKAQSLENAYGIGFSGGNFPTNTGSEYPYFYYNNGTTQSLVAIATQGWVNNTFATLSSLNNYATLNTVQTFTANKSFDSSSNVSFLGNDQNNVLVHKTSTGLTGNLVSGHDYTHYSSRWRVGNVRGGSVNSTEFSFLYSSDNGTSFSERMKIDAGNGQITTPIHGNSAEWHDIAQNGIRTNTGFTVDEDYREIDHSTFDIDDPNVKKFTIVFNSSSNGHVLIHNPNNAQYFQLLNTSATSSLEVEVSGYGVVDSVDPGKFSNYMGYSSGKFAKLNPDGTLTQLI